MKEQAFEFGKIMAITISVVVAIFISEEAIKRIKSLLKALIEWRYALLSIFFFYSAAKPEFIQSVIGEVKNASVIICVIIALYFQYRFFKPEEGCKVCDERRKKAFDDVMKEIDI